MKEQDRELWERYIESNGDIGLRNELITRYMPLVEIAARKYEQKISYQVRFEELVSSGIIGLIQAIENYRPDKGVFF
jgi:DNA-directed RNA polymerase specialized sigma subunit